MKYSGRPYIYSPDYAFLFASSAVNELGELGLLCYYGGQGIPPSLAFGTRENLTDAISWGMLSVIESTDFPKYRDTNGTFDYPWGDYVTLRPHHGLSNTWDAAGFVLEGGNTPDRIVPYYFLIQKQESTSDIPVNLYANWR
jgi:hypothetical protein